MLPNTQKGTCCMALLRCLAVGIEEAKPVFKAFRPEGSQADRLGLVRGFLDRFPQHVNSQSVEGEGLLYCAVRADEQAAVQLLLERGSDPDQRNIKQPCSSPVHAAGWHCRVQVWVHWQFM